MNALRFSLALVLPVCSAIGATYSVTFGNLNTTIADGNPVGVALTGSIPNVSSREIVSGITVGLTTTGGFNGDLYSYLTSPNGNLVLLFNQPGVTASDPFGFQGSGLSVTLQDAATAGIQSTTETPAAVFDGEYQPLGSLGTMIGSAAQGPWTLFLADLAPGAQATLLNWSLNVTTTTSTSSVYWTGETSSAWDASASNWKLSEGHHTTQFLANDVVFFNDTLGHVTVDISGGDVSPSATHFTNSTATNYTLQGSNGIATGLVTKVGSGQVTFANTHTYSGPTTINCGKLIINGSIATSCLTTVNSNGTLSGTGTTGALTIANGGTLAPTAQASGSPMTIAGNLTFETGSIFEWNLIASHSDPGAGFSNQGSYSQVAATSVSNLAADSVLFKILLDGNLFTDAFWDTNKEWSNILMVGASPYSLVSLFTATQFSGDVAANGMVANQGQFSFGDSTLHWVAVPEPTTALAGLLLCAGLLRRRRLGAPNSTTRQSNIDL